MKALSTLVLAVAMSASVTAQSFQYTDFSSTAGLTLNGSATQTGGQILRITARSQNQNGAAWRTQRVAVLGGFDTQFDFAITPGGVLAEGMAFVVHNDSGGASTLGGGVWGLGYGPGSNNSPIANSLAIEIDTYQDGFQSDTSANEISVHTNGTGPNDAHERQSIGRTTPTTVLSDGASHTMRVLYVPGTLSIFVDDLVNPVLTVPYDLQTGGTLLSGGGSTGGLNLPNGTAWVGFTGTTGANNLNERKEIFAWTWASADGPDACYAGSVGASMGSPVNVLRVDGSAGGFLRTVEVSSFDPFTIDVDAPPGSSSALYALFGSLGAPDGTTNVMTPWGADLCFMATAPLRFGAGPAPVSIPIPAGVPLLGEIAIQGVIDESTGGPPALAVTNTVVLDFVAPPTPSIVGVSPTSAAPGATVTIDGSGFSRSAVLTVAGMDVTPTQLTRRRVRFAYPAGLGCDAPVVVTNPDGQSASATLNPTPVILNQTITSGPAAGGTIVVVSGTGFALGSTVTVGGAPATVLAAGAVSVAFRTPAGSPGTAPVVITTPGGCTANGTFTYQ